MAIDWEKAMSSSGTKKKKNNIDWEKAGAYTDKELNAFSQKKSVADSKISAAQNSNTNAFKSMTPSKAMKAPTEAEAMEWVTSRDYYFGTSKVTSTSNSPASQLRLDAKYKQPTTTTSKTPSANIPQTDKGKTNIENTIALIDENEKNGVSTKHLTRDERNQKAWEKTAVEYDALDDDTLELLDTMADVQDYNDRATMSVISQIANRGSTNAGAETLEATKAQERASVAKETLKEQGYSDNEIESLTEYRRQQRNAEQSAEISQIIKEETEQHPVQGSALSVMTNLASPMAVVEVARAKAKGVPIDPNSKYFSPTQMTSDIRGEVQENYDWNIDLNKDGESWDAFDFVYGAGMSTADSLVAGAIMPNIGIATQSKNFVVKALAKAADNILGGSLIGSQAMVNTIQDVTKRGGTTNEAINAGVVSFLAETLSEAWSIGNFKRLQESGKKGLWNLAKDLLKSAGVNASEEAVTEAVNLVYDRYALGDKSNFELNVKAYMQTQKLDGSFYTREEAEEMAWHDAVMQVAEAAASGAFQGVMMGGTANVTGRVFNYAEDSKAGEDIRKEGVTDAVVEAARTSEDKIVQEYVQRINKKGKENASNADIGAVAREMLSNEKTATSALETISSYSRPITLKSEEKVQITHPTLSKADGKVISLSSVESVKDGKITVKNSEGATQTLDINKLEGKAKELWSYASKHFSDAQAVTSFINSYDGQNIDVYSRNYKAVFDLASVGMTAQQIEKEDIFEYRTLGEKAFDSAIRAGHTAMSYKQGVVDLTTQKKSNSQKLIMRMADEFGKRHGMNITFVDTLGTREGFLTPGKNQIVIALDSSKGAISRTLGHETYHYVEVESPQQAKEISEFVIDTLTRLKGEKWVNDMYAFYEKNGYDTLEAQKSELVADQMFEVFANERAVNEFVAKDRTFAQKVLDHIKGLIAEIKNIYKKLVATGNYEDIAAWQEDLDALQKVNDMMLDALSNIEQRKNAGQKTEKNTSDEVVNSVSRNPAQTKYENDVDAVINGTYNSDSALIMGVTPKIYQDLGFNKLPIAITKNHVYSIAVTEQQAKADGRYNKNVNYHGLGVQAVKDIYQNISDPIMIIVSPDFQSKTQRESVHKVIAVVDLQVGGKQVIAPIEIDAEVENNNFKRIDVNLVSSYFDKSNLNKMLSEAVAQESTGDVGFYYVDKNRAKSIFKKSKVQYLSRLDSLNSNGIIHKIDEKVNRKIDSVLKSKQFIRWFGDWQNKPETASKIVNADGTPKIMYHGTQNDFTVFDKKKAKSSGYYGRGFYFTDSESHASHYGNAMAVYLDVKNPLEQGKNHISKKQLRNFLEAVAENEDDYDIWNYGTEDIDEIINNIYKDDAFAVIQDVNATAIGDLAEAIDLFNKVNKTNYDGVITPTETVVYKPTQIKSATDNIGTFDKDNPDIRFSTKRDADYMTAVESGDMETAQKMVDEAAKKAGYTVKGYHGTGADFTIFDESKVGGRNVWGRGFYFGSSKGIADDYAQWRERKGGKSRIVSAYLKFKNPFIPSKSSLGSAEEILDKWFPDMWQSSRQLGIGYIQGKLDGSVVDLLQFIAEHNKIEIRDVLTDYGYDGIIDGGEIVAFKSNQIKSADPVTYDNNGEVVPLSKRFDASEGDIRFAKKRPWTTGMQPAEVIRIERIAKNELYKTDNYLDNITKWLYNDRNGTPYFALYSTENDENPTILYASKNKNAEEEYNFILECLKELEATHDDGKTEIINKILENFGNTDNLRAVYSVVPSNRQLGTGNVTVHSGQSGFRVSRALRVCLQDSFERRTSVKDIKRSTKRDSSISEDASNYILNTKEYQEVLSILDERMNLVAHKNLSPKAINYLAGKLLNKVKSNYSREQLTERLTALFDYIANSRDVSWEEITEIAAQISKDVLKESSVLDRSRQKEYADVLKLMKETKVYISPEQKAEIKMWYGSYDAFRRLVGNKIGVTVTDTSAVPLDVFWRELSENRPEMFNAETNYLDMPAELVTFFEMTSPQYINPYDGVEMDMDEASYDMALQIYDEYFNIPEVKTEAQKYALKEERLKGRYNAKIKDIHNTYRERIKKLRKEKNNKIEATKALYRQRHEDYRDKRNETDEKRRYRASIVRTSKKLVEKLVKPTDTKYIPQELIKPVTEFCQTVTNLGMFDYERTDRLVIAYRNIIEGKIGEGLESVTDQATLDDIEVAKKLLDKKKLSDLNVVELRLLRDITKDLHHLVTSTNKMFNQSIREGVIETGEQILDEFKDKKTDNKRYFQAEILKPVVFFDLLESPTMNKLYQALRKGEDNWYVEASSIKDKIAESRRNFNYEKWTGKTVMLELERGKTVALTMDEALSLYATSQRNQGLKHLLGDGFVIQKTELAKINKALKKNRDITKETRKEIIMAMQGRTIKLTVRDIQNLTSKIREVSEDAIGYAENLVQYMSKDMADLGNEVALKLKGRKIFGEDKYYPIESDPNFLNFAAAKGVDARLKNMRSTHQTVENAKNAVVIASFSETVAKHCLDMAMYSSFTLPLEDFTRVFNYKIPSGDLQGDAVSVRQEIERVYGSKAVSSIQNLLKDLNKNVVYGQGTGLTNKMISMFKRNAVMGSMSVAIQQPSAYLRAAAYLDSDVFFKPHLFKSFSRNEWETIKKYAPIAGIKDMGYFDTNLGKSSVEWVLDENLTAKNKFRKSVDSFNDKLAEIPSFMDRITWSYLWQLTKDEQKKRFKKNEIEVDVNSEEFLNAVGERFTEVVEHTQVYDSVFARPEMARSQDTGVKQLMAFTNEPLVSYNMFVEAITLKKDKKSKARFIGKTVGSLVLSFALNSALKAVVQTINDDDEDETPLEQYIANLTNNFFLELFGFGAIPYLSELIETIKTSYDPERTDTQFISEILNMVKIVSNENKTPHEKGTAIASILGFAMGIPVGNLTRSIEGILKGARETVKGITGNRDIDTTNMGVHYTAREKLGFGYKKPNDAKQAVLAYLDGDTEHYEREMTILRKKYENDEKKVDSQIKTALGELYKDGDIIKEQAEQILKDEYDFDKDELYWQFDKWDGGADYSKYGEFYDAVESGKNIRVAVKHYTDNGVEKSDLASQITTHYKDQYIELYKTNRSEASKLKTKLVEAYAALGYKRADKSKDIDEWLKPKKVK